MHGGVDVGGSPVHDGAQLVPVVHLFPGHIFQRRPGDNHAVVGLVLDLFKGGIKSIQMAGVSVGGLIAGGLQQLHPDL